MLKRRLFQWETPKRANGLLINTDVPFTKSLSCKNGMESPMRIFKESMHEAANGNLTWCAGRTPSEVQWLACVEDAVFGALWDSHL